MVRGNKDKLINLIVEEIRDYRNKDNIFIDYNHVLKWINQFDINEQEILLEETLNFIKNRYFREKDFYNFYKSNLETIFGIDYMNSLNEICLLDIQKYGTSQHELVNLMNSVLMKEKGITISTEYLNKKNYIYLDEGIFSGNRIINDLKSFIFDNDVKDVKIIIQVIISHTEAEQYIKAKLLDITQERNIDFQLFRAIISNNTNMNHNGVIYPEVIPSDHISRKYLAEFDNYFNDFPNYYYLDETTFDKDFKLFSSTDNVELIEEVFLKYGIKLLNEFSPNELVRPLGFSKLLNLGFGAIFFTYRNIPNNCPIIFWYNEREIFKNKCKTYGWFPLFPRKFSKENVAYNNKGKSLLKWKV